MQITDYNYITSSLGNGYFSGLTLEELWDCCVNASNKEELDAAITITIKLKEMIKGDNNE